MTTIAYRDGVLAADSLVTENGRIMGYVRKVRGTKGVAWAVTGCLIHTGQFDAWVLNGMRGDPPTMKTPEGATSTALVIGNGYLLTFDEHGFDAMPLPEFHAAGSGGPYALGAMAHGASAEEAVGVGIKVDCYSGGKIQSVSVR